MRLSLSLSTPVPLSASVFVSVCLETAPRFGWEILGVSVKVFFLSGIEGLRCCASDWGFKEKKGKEKGRIRARKAGKNYARHIFYNEKRRWTDCVFRGGWVACYYFVFLVLTYIESSEDDTAIYILVVLPKYACCRLVWRTKTNWCCILCIKYWY